MENHLNSLSRYCIAELPTNVLSDFKTAIESVRDELKLNDNVFRGVDGFLAKYFEKPSWSPAVKDTIRGAKSADIVKLSRDIFNIVRLGTLMDWLVDFRSLFFTADPKIRFRCEPITTPELRFSASIYFETEDISTAAGSTRVYGEYHHGDAHVAGDDNGFLPFAARALQVSELIDLGHNPQELLRILAGYGMMDDKESGVNTFVKCFGLGLDSYVSLSEDFYNKMYLRPEMIAAPGYLVGLGTTCFAASESTTDEPDIVVKFSWRADNTTTEPRMLWLAHKGGVKGIIKLLGHQDLVSIADLRQPLQFPRSFVNRTLSCFATSPLGRPIRKYVSISELLEVLGDLVKAIQSLYEDGRMIHRDIAIKNLVISPQGCWGNPMGILIDFDSALKVKKGHPVGQRVGSDGFMAIGVLRGEEHTYRHDLESLFYVFLWLAIANDREHDHAREILKGLPEKSRLHNWCSPVLNFSAVEKAVTADMSPQGFEGILGEFSPDFVELKNLARRLHGLIFPVRDGMIFTGTDKDKKAATWLFTTMANAFMDKTRCQRTRCKGRSL
ncbi:hypothetical protein M431DRAFT_98889 [Trichoderma harzianum CBS 226.95]|uniref:EKC/KEOPS complex subunit BUD32 n=1 Tax=Trichoderma harzianum CBS 226.95 TaxID=983964 RepID=A0A2T3ZVM0_TRIHA|nr:hypothetical protein M431DRAFT_98889 [Trichoderma harzianum CBS 226.95]PTB48866.1 hypothetical protein M431DRAFT_98889 [Trichoderma harzianum CBS 226.95]